MSKSLVYGIGSTGEGEYSSRINGEKTIQYEYWLQMLRRCYSEKYLKKRPTYEDKYVCDEWHNFQNFAKWFDENYYEVENQTMQLDKDILSKGNKIYSPDNCIFVPDRINSLFIKSNATRGKYPIGVSYYKKTNKFISTCSIYNEDKMKRVPKHLGYFNTPEEAFYKYKEFKEGYIKEVAEEYKEAIPHKLYKAMCDYLVEIDD